MGKPCVAALIHRLGSKMWRCIQDYPSVRVGSAVELLSYACSLIRIQIYLFEMSGVDTTTGTAVMVREFGAGLVKCDGVESDDPLQDDLTCSRLQ